MTMPTYDQVLDFTDNFWNRFKKTDGQPKATSSKGALLAEATKRYDNIVGRFDSMERIPSRTLLAPQDDDEKRFLQKNGAVAVDGVWIVPEGVDLSEKFEPWFPAVSADLRDTTPRLVTTKNGRSVESYVLPSDRAKGSDSTATPLMYGGIALTSAIVYLLSSIWAPLGLLGALLYIPFVAALTQGEGPMEGAKSFFLLGMGPLALAYGSSLGAGRMITGLIPGGGLVGVGIGLPVLFVLSFIAAFVLDRFDPNRSASVMGGTFEKFKSIVKWTLFYVAAYVLCSTVLPVYLHPFFFLAWPCLYPMVYTNANFVRRAKLLKEHGERFNLGRMGALSSMHVEPKRMQAVNAAKDTTPIFVIGTATGWLTKKHYAYAPDKGVDMCLSALDSSKHILVYGETGIGKTTMGARGYAMQWVESNHGGFLCLCGKGALPGDLSGIIEVMIETGVDFAPFHGLDGNGIAIALNSTAKSSSSADPKNAVWTEGASNIIRYAATLFEALNKHEKGYLQYASDMASLKELDIDAAIVEVARLEKLGEDSSEAREKHAKLKADFDGWAKIRDGGRKWLWNVDTFVKVLNMINEPIQVGGNWMPGKLLTEAVNWLGYEEDLNIARQRRATNPTSMHPEIGSRGLLDDALTYVLKTWTQGTEPQQRSSFFINVMQRVLPLTTGPYLTGKNGQHWKTLETGVDAGACLFGGKVGVHMPEEKHQEAGLLISALVKQRVYNSVALRGGEEDWTKDGQKPLLLMMDECQDLISSAERMLLPKSRSLGMYAYMLTQGFEGLQNKLGSEMEAMQFCNTFQNYICFRSSPQTYKYLAERFGTAQMLSYVEQTTGLDMDGGVRALAASPLNDLEHPNRAALKKMERLGAGRLVVRTLVHGKNEGGWEGHRMANIEDDRMTKDIAVPMGGKLEIQPLFLPEEFSALTSFGQAIVFLNRAGERRVDVAKMHPVYENELRKKEKDKEPELEEA